MFVQREDFQVPRPPLDTATPHGRAARTIALADAVRTRRRDLRLRQDQLAELAEVSERFVHSVESGKPTLQLDKLLSLLEALGLHLAVASGVRDGVVDARGAAPHPVPAAPR